MFCVCYVFDHHIRRSANCIRIICEEGKKIMCKEVRRSAKKCEEVRKSANCMRIICIEVRIVCELYACVYVHMNMCGYTCIANIYVHTHMKIYRNTHMHVLVYISTQPCVDVRV